MHYAARPVILNAGFFTNLSGLWCMVKNVGWPRKTIYQILLKTVVNIQFEWKRNDKDTSPSTALATQIYLNKHIKLYKYVLQT